MDLLDLHAYDKVIVSFSGGKDCTAALLDLRERGVDPQKVELWHQHVDGEPGSEGLMDWPCTESYVRAFAQALGLTVRFQWKEGGFEGEMCRKDALTRPSRFQLADGTIGQAGGVRGKPATRERFPQKAADLSVRWCSAYLKIDVAAIALNNDPTLQTGNILFITGERRQESTARSKYDEVLEHRCNNKRRRVDQWRSVIDWTEERVWQTIERHRIQVHPAYYLGWGRVSCLACIFGDKDQWASVRELTPERFVRIADYERRWGCTITKGRTVLQMADQGTPFPQLSDERYEHYRRLALSTDYPASEIIVPEWHLPAGAYKRCGGPT